MESKNRSVLVVEDDTRLREMVVEFLTSVGFVIFQAADVDAALAQVKAHPEISVVFTDINLPGRRTGCDLAREVHNARADINFILTSGRRLPADCNMPPGGIFISKPYLGQNIARMIAGLVG